MRPATLRSRLVPLLVITLLVGVARVAGAVPAEPIRKERIEEVWLDAKGESGWIRTTPMYLDDAPAEVHFGPKFCPKGHRLGAQTLQALLGALASGLPVRVDAEPVGSGAQARQCVTGVAFFAPLP